MHLLLWFQGNSGWSWYFIWPCDTVKMAGVFVMSIDGWLTIAGLGVGAYLVYWIYSNGGALSIASDFWDKFLNGG